MSPFDIDRLQAETFLASVDHHAQLPSTNDRAIEILKDRSDDQATLKLPLLVLAEVQTQGRGQRDRSWVADEGALTFSLCVKSTHQTWESAIPVGVALAVCRAIEVKIGRNFDQLGIKWPNDVLFGGCKLGGILIEKIRVADAADGAAEGAADGAKSGAADGVTTGNNRLRDNQDLDPNLERLPTEQRVLVIGIGINVNNQIRSEDIHDDNAKARSKNALAPISLATAIGKPIELTELLIELIRQVEKTLHLLSTNATDVMADVYRRMVFADNQVTVQQPNDQLLSGQVRGLSPEGQLIVVAGGHEHLVTSGQVIDWSRTGR